MLEICGTRSFIKNNKEVYMINTNYQNLMNDLYLSGGIPFWIASISGQELHAFPNNISHMLQNEIFEFCIQEMKKHTIKNDIFMYYLDDSYYLTMCMLDENCFLMTVPLTFAYHVSIPYTFLRNFVYPETLSPFTHFMADVRSVSSFQVTRYINLIRQLYCGENAGSLQTHHANHYNEVDFSEEQPSVHQENPDNVDISYRYKVSTIYEEDVSSAISAGDVHGFFQAYFRPFQHKIGQMSSDALRQQRYQFIIQIYAISRAAIRGGLNPEFAFQLSDFYCQKMDIMNSVAGIAELILEAGSDFCHRVKEAKKASDLSPTVNSCCEYIRSHLYETIRLEQIGRASCRERV